VAAVFYHDAMTQLRDGHGADRDSRALLAIAKQFRDAAATAGRPDVVAKIDEAIILLARTDHAAGKVDGSDDKANVVLRILDGLGF
jgi:hypothetical protein